MKKHLVIIGCFISTLLLAEVSHAGCAKDTDCKGDRICHQGLCTTPAPPAVRSRPAPVYSHLPSEAPPPGVALPATAARVAPGAPVVAARYAPAPVATAAPTPAPPLTWPKGYAEVGTPINFQGWAGFMDSDVKISSGFGAGIRLAGYYAARAVHVGGYLSYATADYTAEGYEGSAEAANLSGGVALKLGGAVGSRIWMGFALDAGFNVLFKGDAFAYNHTGLSFYTGYVLDVLAVGRGAFKMAVTSRLGTHIEPYLHNEGADQTMWQVRLGLTIGATFGGRSG